MILTASNIGWEPSKNFEVYKIMNDLGFKGIEVAPGKLFENSDDVLNPSNSLINEKLEEIKSYGLSPVSMQSILFGCSDALLFSSLNEHKNKFIERLKAAITLSNKLGIKNIVFGSPKNRNIPNNLRYEYAEKIAYTIFNDIGKYALKNDVILSIEANPSEYQTNFINTLQESITFIEKINVNSIMLNLDMGEIILNKQEEYLNNNMKKIKELINHVHISEPFLEPSPMNAQHCEHILKNLMYNDYKKSISLEMNSIDDNLKTLTKKLEVLSKIFVRLNVI
jgi:sugar phosphate isomerase/epimerase